MLNPVTENVLAELRAALPEGTVAADTARYLEEPRRIAEGTAASVLRPATTEEVAAIVRMAAASQVAVIPYGGGTGLVGGQVFEGSPPPLVLSLERMNRIRAVHPRENVLIVEAGATLSEVQAAAVAAGRLFPLSLASEGTARIGGNLSTNAGGVQVLRYGNARELCLGLEAVMPDGRIWNGLRRLRKDNTGYDLKSLLIGAEGTLGVITAASLRLFPLPGSVATAALVVEDPDAALNLLALASERLGAGLTAFELVHRQGLDFLDESRIDYRDPFSQRPEWFVLAEVALADVFDAQDAIEQMFTAAFEQNLVTDGFVARSEGQRRALWQMRESIPEANRHVGAIASHDISLPLSAIPVMIRRCKEALDALGDFRINVFGHMGDGNLHYNVFPQVGKSRSDYPEMAARVTRVIHDLVQDLDGSFSAEHGVGRFKVGELERLGDPVKLAAMRAIKAAIDPLGIMNPGAVLRSS